MKHYQIILAYLLLLATHGLFSQDANSEFFSDKDKVFVSTKVFGLISQYEKSVFNQEFDFNQHFLKNYNQLLSVHDRASLNEYLEELMSPFDYSDKISDQSQANFLYDGNFSPIEGFEKVSESVLKPDFNWIQHPSISEKNRARLVNLLLSYAPSKRKDIKKNSVKISHKEDFINLKGDSTAIFTLGMMQLWNKVYYYFPYKRYMDTNWDQVLKQEAHLIVNMRTKQDYYDHLDLMCAYLNDSHGFVSINDYQVWQYGFGMWLTYPLEATVLNNCILITGVASHEQLSDLKPGDTITHINEKPSIQYLKEISRKIIASNKTDSIRQLNRKLFMPYNHPDLGDSIIVFTVNGKSYKISPQIVKYSDYNKFLNIESQKPKTTGLVSDKIGYINLVNTKGKKVNQAFRMFKSTEHLILDLRGYPPSSLIKFLSKNLSKKSTDVASFYYPSYGAPGFFQDYRKAISYYVSNNFDFLLLALSFSKGKIIPTFRKPYKGQMIVLINEKAISYAETIAMIIKTYRPETLFIGRPSNGANGDVTSFPLPYNISVSISGLDWHYADGSQLQRIGITPDVLVERSIEELVLGNDIIYAEALKSIIQGDY